MKVSTIRQHYRTMVQALSVLSVADKRRMKFHLEKGTRVVCGEESSYRWTDGKGGG